MAGGFLSLGKWYFSGPGKLSYFENDATGERLDLNLDIQPGQWINVVMTTEGGQIKPRVEICGQGATEQ